MSGLTELRQKDVYMEDGEPTPHGLLVMMGKQMLSGFPQSNDEIQSHRREALEQRRFD